MQNIPIKITKQQSNRLKIGAAMIVAVYIVLSIVFGLTMSNSREHSVINHQNRMDASKVEIKYPQPKPGFTEVKVGTYLENITDLSIADSTFTADFYIWFSWQGENDLDPGEMFQIVGGTINAKELASAHHSDDGKHYQRFKVSATINKVFDTTRLSLEDHMLNIYIEDKKRDGASLQYVVDTNSAISSRVKIPGFRVTKFQEVSKPHEYKSSFSSPSAANDSNRVFSQYAMGISLSRADFGFYLKIFLPFLLAVILGLIVLRTKSELIDARTSLAGASFFGVIANAYVVSGFVPAEGGAFGLLDILNITSLLSVLLIVGITIMSHNLHVEGEDPEYLAALDKAAFYSIAFGYLLLSVVLPLCTYLNV